MIICKYAIGEALKKECQDNDCRLFLNMYNMVQEATVAYNDIEASGKYSESALLLLKKGIREYIKQLHEMYHSNFAIQKYKTEHKYPAVMLAAK